MSLQSWNALHGETSEGRYDYFPTFRRFCHRKLPNLNVLGGFFAHMVSIAYAVRFVPCSCLLLTLYHCHHRFGFAKFFFFVARRQPKFGIWPLAHSCGPLHAAKSERSAGGPRTALGSKKKLEPDPSHAHY